MASKGHGSGLIELSQASSFRSREFSLGDRLSALRARTNKLTGLEDGARSRSELEAVAEASLKETGSHGLYWSTSGGSTGAPKYFPCDIRENKLMRSLFLRLLISTAVVRDTDIVLGLFTSSNMYRSQEIFQEFFEGVNATYLPMGSDAKPEKKVEAIRKFSPNTICGTSSAILRFCEELRNYRDDEGNHFQPKFTKIIHGGETLTEATEKLFKTLLCVEEIHSVYGSAETGVWGLSPHGLPRNVFIYDSRTIHLDFESANSITDIEDNHPCLLRVTNLVRYRIPVYRYRCGDAGSDVEINTTWKPLSTMSSADLKHVKAFHFHGRGAQSFSLGSYYFDVTYVDSLINQKSAQKKIEVLQWQIVILNNAQAQVRIVFSEESSPWRAAEIAASIEIILRKDLNQRPLITVAAAHVGELRRSETSRKIPLIVHVSSPEVDRQ